MEKTVREGDWVRNKYTCVEYRLDARVMSQITLGELGELVPVKRPLRLGDQMRAPSGLVYTATESDVKCAETYLRERWSHADGTPFDDGIRQESLASADAIAAVQQPRPKFQVGDVVAIPHGTMGGGKGMTRERTVVKNVRSGVILLDGEDVEYAENVFALVRSARSTEIVARPSTYAEAREAKRNEHPDAITWNFGRFGVVGIQGQAIRKVVLSAKSEADGVLRLLDVFANEVKGMLADYLGNGEPISARPHPEPPECDPDKYELKFNLRHIEDRVRFDAMILAQYGLRGDAARAVLGMLSRQVSAMLARMEDKVVGDECTPMDFARWLFATDPEVVQHVDRVSERIQDRAEDPVLERRCFEAIAWDRNEPKGAKSRARARAEAMVKEMRAETFANEMGVDRTEEHVDAALAEAPNENNMQLLLRVMKRSRGGVSATKALELIHKKRAPKEDSATG